MAIARDKKGPGSNSKRLLVVDSKKVFNTSRKKELAAEETVLAFFYLCFNFLPESADQFLEVVIDPSTTTYNPSCFCWKNDLGLQLNPERRKHILKSAEKLRKRAQQKSVTLEKPRCLLFCPSLFNNGLKNQNKSGLVLEAGLNLLRQYIETATHACREVKRSAYFTACLGKIGGLRYYQEHISTFFGPQFTVTPTREEKNNSAYKLNKSGKPAGTIIYLQDGEENSFLIALSSLFGKYTRDLFWKKTRTYLEEFLLPLHLTSPQWGERKGEGENRRYHASGYRDSLTKRFIRETEELRKKLNIPDDCFLRRK